MVHRGLWLLTLAIATVASVPTSVLVQNSELSSTSSHLYENPKVKRSPTMKESATSAAAAMNKKSSPEIVPASYNSPPSVSSGAASLDAIDSLQSTGGGRSLSTNGDLINSAIAAGLTAAAIEAAAAASQRELQLQQQQQQQQQQLIDDYRPVSDDLSALPRKRGINGRQYLYRNGGGGGGGGDFGDVSDGYTSADYYGQPLMSSVDEHPLGGLGSVTVPNGVWSGDDVEPQIGYADPQAYAYDVVHGPRVPYHSKAYDNLQNILNSETYMEPLPYRGRYSGANADKKKRSRLNRFNDMRLKRDTQLTPADILAFVALVEAGERSHKNPDDSDESFGAYPEMYGNSNAANHKAAYYPGPGLDYNQYNSNYMDGDNDVDEYGNYKGAWLQDPAVVDYYGLPYTADTLPKYEGPREHRFTGHNRHPAKRFMVSKRKRSMGQLLDEPAALSNAGKYF